LIGFTYVEAKNSIIDFISIRSKNFKVKALQFIFIIIAFGCQRQGKLQLPEIEVNEIVSLKEVNNSRFHIKEDSFQIELGVFDTLRFRKQEFNQLIDEHPEFFFNEPINPDSAYILNGKDFDSEVEQDTYYQVYAYFLRKKNMSKKLKIEREKLTKIYNAINDIYGYIQQGGTFFGHHDRRMPAYVEYALYSPFIFQRNAQKAYFFKEKQDYIGSLLVSVDKGVNLDDWTLESEKPTRKKEIIIFVNELDSLITDIQYLKEAQRFHNSHYSVFKY